MDDAVRMRLQKRGVVIPNAPAPATRAAMTVPLWVRASMWLRWIVLLGLPVLGFLVFFETARWALFAILVAAMLSLPAITYVVYLVYRGIDPVAAETAFYNETDGYMVMTGNSEFTTDDGGGD